MTIRPPFGKHRTRRTEHSVFTPRVETPEAMALRAEARRCWAEASGMAPDGWIGASDPLVEPLQVAVRTALQAGAVTSTEHGWSVLTATDGVRLVVAANLVKGDRR